jgi:hypothetical protein
MDGALLLQKALGTKPPLYTLPQPQTVKLGSSAFLLLLLLLLL